MKNIGEKQLKTLLFISLTLFDVLFLPVIAVLFYKIVLIVFSFEGSQTFSLIIYILSFLLQLLIGIIFTIKITNTVFIRLLGIILSFPLAFLLSTLGFNILLFAWYLLKLPVIDPIFNTQAAAAKP